MKKLYIIPMLDSLYDKTLNGIPKINKPIDDVINDYLSKDPDIEVASKKFIKSQIKKCTISGFLTGFGGVITLPIAVPANVSSVLYVQMRMIAGIAHMGGYNINSDQVQTLVYACLAGISVNQVLKQTGVKFGEKLAVNTIKKIPGKTLTKINQKVGFKFMTKSGENGIINLWKATPIVGAVIGGSFDLVETKAIANRAYKMFILGDLTVSDEKYDDSVSDEKF